MDDRDMKRLEELWSKDPNEMTDEEESLLDQLNAEYDAEFGYFEDD